MIVLMRTGATQTEVDDVVQRAKSLELGVQLNLGTDKTVVAILGSNTGQLPTETFAVLPGVESVTRIMKPYKLASREFKAEDSLVSVNGIEIGGKRIVVMAGPCAVESEEQLMEVARVVKESGASLLRGGAFKPRTSPFSFQGLEKDGLELLARAREQFGIPIITEVIDPHDVDLVSKYADILQVQWSEAPSGISEDTTYVTIFEKGKAGRNIALFGLFSFATESEAKKFCYDKRNNLEYLFGQLEDLYGIQGRFATNFRGESHSNYVNEENYKKELNINASDLWPRIFQRRIALGISHSSKPEINQMKETTHALKKSAKKRWQFWK